MIYMGHESGFVEESYYPIRDLLDSHEKLKWEYQSPSSIFVYFEPSESNREIANEIVGSIAKLRNEQESLRHLKVGIGEGMVIAEFDRKGNLKHNEKPIGEAVENAIKNAA